MTNEDDLAKWLAGEMTESERKTFESSSSFATYNKIALYSKQLTTPNFKGDEMLKEILKSKSKKSLVVPLQKTWFFKIACVLVLAFGLLFLTKNYYSVNEITRNGEELAFNLPDDSHVILNSDSQIDYKKWNWNNKRSLNLNGEAFFKVTKGKTFDVVTNIATVTVVGTQFSVKTRKKRLEVECFEGKVKVTYSNKSTFIKKGEIIVVENNKILYALPTNAAKPTWMTEEIRIISMPLHQILNELEYNYDVKFDQDFSGYNSNFSGYLPKNNFNLAMKILSETYQFKFKVDKKSVKIE